MSTTDDGIILENQGNKLCPGVLSETSSLKKGFERKTRAKGLRKSRVRTGDWRVVENEKEGSR